MRWLAHLLLPPAILSDLQRDVTQVLWTQIEILTRLRKIQEQLDRLTEPHRPEEN